MSIRGQQQAGSQTGSGRLSISGMYRQEEVLFLPSLSLSSVLWYPFFIRNVVFGGSLQFRITKLKS